MRVFVLSSHTNSLFWFRMDMMNEFIRNGHDVLAVGNLKDDQIQKKFQQNNILYKHIYVERNSLNLIGDLRTIIDLLRLFKENKPKKIFAYQAKTIIYGSLVARLLGIKEFYPMIAGLGSVFRGRGFKNLLLKKILIFNYRNVCKHSKMVFIQNNDDKNELINYGVVNPEKLVLTNGSGVNIQHFQVAPLPAKITFLFIGRLIKDKGIIEYCEACKVIKTRYPDVRCMLVGPYDSNPSSISRIQLEEYTKNDVIEYFGEQHDVRPYITQCSVFILPSYHEGTPKTVLEAMSMGRPIITCNSPGCRETVVNGLNGYLVEIKDVWGIVEKMEYFIHNSDVIPIMGADSRKIACNTYDVNIVNKLIVETMGLNKRVENQTYD